MKIPFWILITMATASDNPYVSTLEVEEDLSCCICYNLLREPKDLDCQHVYCLQCLQNWVGKQSTIECPECRIITVVPQGGLAYLKTDLRLKNIVEKYADCIEKQKTVPMCSNHEGERQHFFCVTCGTTVCHDCLVLEHPRPQHDIKELKVITKTRKADIKVKMDGVQEEVTKSKEDERKLNYAEIRLKKETEKARRDIKKHAQELVAKVEAERDQMMQRLETTCQQHMKILQEKQNHTKERIMRLQNSHLATQNVVDTAADHVYLTQHASLVDKIGKLCITQHEAPSWDFNSLRFNPAQFPTDSQWFDDGVLLIGNKICELKLVNEFGSFQCAEGIAANQAGLLAVVDEESKKVNVFKCENGEFKSQYWLNGSSSDRHSDETLVNPYDVAVTSDGKFYVTDTIGLVKIFSPSGRYVRSFKSNGTGPTATTTDDAIITGNIYTHEITVFQTVGENYKMMKTHKTGPYGVEKIASNGKQIVYTTGTKGTQGRVYAIDFETGQDLWSLDMEWSGGICYEYKSNTLLVAGTAKVQGESVIEQHCSTTGRLMSRLVTDLLNPVAMTFTHDNKLLVADNFTVKVYEIQ